MSTAYPWDDDPTTKVVGVAVSVREDVEPAHDPATGEVYPDVDTDTIVDVEVVNGELEVDPATITAEVVAFDFGDRADAAVRTFTTPTEVETLGVELRREVLRRTRTFIETLHQARTWTGKPTKTDVAGETRRLGEAHLVLDEVGDAFKAGAGELNDALGDLVLAVTEKDAGTSTLRVDAVPDPDGGAPRGYKVTRLQGSKESVDDAKVVDVIVADLVALFDPRGDDPDARPTHVETEAYAQGVRNGIAVWLELAAAHTLKGTALAAYERRLAASDDPTRVALAKRLEAAHGKVPVGTARTKVERVESKEKPA